MFRLGLSASLFFVILWGLGGCMPFQTQVNPFQLSASQSLAVGPERRLLHLYERGKKGDPALVFLHGYASAGSIWLPLMEALARDGYYSLALDLPGFGLSDKTPGDYKTERIADLIAEAIQQKGIQKADILAHSWGSSVALALRLRHPALVKRLVIHGGWIYSTQIVPVLRWAKIPAIGEVVYWLFFRERPDEKYASSFYDPDRMVDQRVVDLIHKAAQRPGYLAAALAVARGMDFASMETKYRSIENPTLLLWGRQDRVSLPFYGKRLASELPKAQIIFLDRCGHIPMLEQPHQVLRHIRHFLGPARSSRKDLPSRP